MSLITKQIADEIISQLWADLANRNGFEEEIDVTSSSTREDIRLAWQKIIITIISKEPITVEGRRTARIMYQALQNLFKGAST